MSSAPRPRPAASDLDRLESSIRARPLSALTLSAGAGFILGGGLRSRLGFALGLFIGRSLAGIALTNAIEALADQNGKQRQSNRERTGRGPARPPSNRDRGQSEG